ncbi:MAG TPA: maleylpyruvate isomerase family mycothiol-dependent enzyme [Sporichthya sp.]|nr:maleylpyruvate isomerase family mycothiol-dependent enzyme [Sporichthya sp.]
MERITTDLAAQHDELRIILTGLTPEQWDAPSLCEGWSVADVVLHLAQSDEVALGSARGTIAIAAPNAGWDMEPMYAGEANVDQIAAAAVEKQRGAAPADLLARWSRSAEALVETFALTDPKRLLPWVIGELPARTLATTRLAECWIHTGDIAHPLDLKMDFGPRLWHVARLAWRTIPYAFERAGQLLAGPVAVILDTPTGEVWEFRDGAALTTVTGDVETFCQVAARRIPGHTSGLHASGPDADAVLDLLRTFA